MNALKQSLNILSWPVYPCIAGYSLIVAPTPVDYRPVVVPNGNMEPVFPVGSVIYYKVASFEQTQEGDSIIFHIGEAGSLVTYRVMEKQELSHDLIIRDDASETVNPNLILCDRVVGRVSDVRIPHAGYFVICDRTPRATGVVGGILVIGMLLDFICSGKRREEGA